MDRDRDVDRMAGKACDTRHAGGDELDPAAGQASAQERECLCGSVVELVGVVESDE
ncbi:Uncharacterised protein [Mycobacteroides abscessus subsp. abscessus]|nr:Uncharacterised protein [Mycobacteroides abscessus subsp. abscessus]